MRFLWRNAIFILFPAVVVAIIFLAQISFSTAERFGEWGERSIAESTLIVTKEKIERVEEIISTTNDTTFRIISPSSLDTACDRWLRSIPTSRLVEAAAIVDENRDVAAFFFRDPDYQKANALRGLIVSEVVPIDDSLMMS